MIIKQPPGYDTSHWKDIPDFTAIEPRPRIIITKATEGNAGIDSKFTTYYPAILAAGYARGCYHFHRKAAYNPKFPFTQAKHFCDTIQPYIQDDDILVLDVEEGGELAEMLVNWFAYVQNQYPNNRVMLYSRKNILDPIPMYMPLVRAIAPRYADAMIFGEHPLNAIEMTAEQRAVMRDIPTWPAGYPANPDLYDTIPSFYIPDQSKYGPPWMWQYSDKGSVKGISGDTDLDWLSAELLAILGDQPPVTEPIDEILEPFMGVWQLRGQRFGCKVYVTVADPLQVTNIQVKNVDDYPSSNCKRYGSQIAWNGDDWDRATRQVIDNAEPSLLIYPDKTLQIGNRLATGGYTAHTSGVRYLLQGGQIKDYLYGSDPKYTERHARSIVGLDAKGSLVHVTIDGDYPDKGATLLESAMIAQEFGAVVAFDGGGGGDSVEVLEGSVVNVPDDDIGGIHYERKVPQSILVFAQESNMANGIAKENKGKTPSVRNMPDISGRKEYELQPWQEFQYVKSVPGSKEPADQWLELPDGNYVNYIVGGITYMQIVKEPITDPAPGDPVIPDKFDATDTWRDDQGNVIATFKGTMIRQ